METISPQTSPTASISPPVTPFSIALPHTYALPPLKTLPTWNRNKFKDDKIVRSVPKNKNIKVELIGQIGQIESCTQTSPYSSSSENGSSAKASLCKKNENSKNNKLKKSFDKKIIFLETTHKEVLTNLHRELEILKNQNRALKFQLVMAGEDSSRLQCDTDEKCNSKPINNGGEETKVLKGEIRELKKLLNEADSRNTYLTKLIEQLKQRSSASRLKSGNLNSKTKTIPRHKSDYSINLLRKDSSITTKQKQNEEQDGGGGGGVKKEKEKQNEVSLLDEKHEKQNIEKNTLFPKLEQHTTNRSAPITSCAPTTSKRIQEPLSLPVLQGLPANRNMALRQKRARALHVRRQRSNKNVTITAATMTTANDE